METCVLIHRTLLVACFNLGTQGRLPAFPPAPKRRARWIRQIGGRRDRDSSGKRQEVMKLPWITLWDFHLGSFLYELFPLSLSVLAASVRCSRSFLLLRQRCSCSQRTKQGRGSAQREGEPGAGTRPVLPRSGEILFWGLSSYILSHYQISRADVGWRASWVTRPIDTFGLHQMARGWHACHHSLSHA